MRSNINLNTQAGKESIIESFFETIDNIKSNAPELSKRQARREALKIVSCEFGLEGKMVKKILKDSDSW